ncbi:hypothetical protein DESA109040_02475 [Deinococcus saxicola]|uniref:hypothetical protein n=1 Tax=Deinococcus saxicola TaxID=249406 RepID=UPI0039F0C075
MERGRESCRALVAAGEEVYGLDLMNIGVRPSPVQVHAGEPPTRPGQWPINATCILVNTLPSRDATPEFWEQPAHLTDVCGLRVDDEHVRLFAWTGHGQVRMASRSLEIDQLLAALEDAQTDRTAEDEIREQARVMAEGGKVLH